jgi:hypothetical protein
MLRWVRRLWAWVVQIEETQSVILWLLSPFGSAVAMISAYWNGLAWYEILFWGSGVFAFFMVGFFYTWTWRQKTTLFEKLSIQSVRIVNILQKDDSSKDIMILTQYTFKNDSDIPMYFLLTRLNLSIDGHVNPNAKIEENVFLVQPHDYHHVTAHGIPNIPQKEMMSGKVEFMVQYGPDKTNLKYLFDYEGTLSLGLISGPDPRAYQANSRLSHRKIEHSLRDMT